MYESLLVLPFCHFVCLVEYMANKKIKINSLKYNKMLYFPSKHFSSSVGILGIMSLQCYLVLSKSRSQSSLGCSVSSLTYFHSRASLGP